MSAPSAGLIELVLVFGAVIAFGVWELYSMRRHSKRSAEARKQPQTGGGEDDTSGAGN
jgi:hypothetical protein